MKTLKLLKKNEEGVTAIEFAILAPTFFLLFLGIIEVGLTMFVDSSLNAATREIARQGISRELDMSGQIEGSDLEPFFQKHLAGLYKPEKIEIINAVTTLDPSNPSIELIDLENASANFLADPDIFFQNGSFQDNDLSGKLVVYFVRYQWGGFSKLVSPFLPEYLYSVTVVRNEDYDNNAGNN